MLHMTMEPAPIAAIAFALLAGGILKGAIGMGSPVVAVPVMASFFDVQLAVALMVVPNLSTNIWQLWTFRQDRIPGRFPWLFALAGAVGVALGTGMLVTFASGKLKLIVAGAVLAYVSLRLLSPNLAVSRALADRLAAPLGAAAGLLQGAAGISAPISVSFLNAMQLSRAVFIPTISLFFSMTAAIQVPLLFLAGVMTPAVLALGAAALVPQLLGMRIGGRLARSVSPRSFDRMILVVLLLLAAKLMADALL
ncbi:sulfite exporter TauE/SafE family protein [Microbulbifer sp. S227A]|uniref:sulfite exporter TauE/SafE family protein n=1 Tax=Microbulbifer sp. S227A TaxID=3415131 RepID=UPI003C7D1C38